MNATPLINSRGEFRSKAEANIIARLALDGIKVRHAVNSGFLATAPGFARYCATFEHLAEFAESVQVGNSTRPTQAQRVPSRWFPCYEVAQWG